jgi:cobalamin biosynthesis Mg chelatase CobN
MFSSIKLPTSLATLKAAVPGTNALKNAAAKVASPSAALNAAKGAAAKVNVSKIAAAAATGNVKAPLRARTNAAKTVAKNTAAGAATSATAAATGVAANAAVTAAAAQVPGGNVAAKMAKNLGIPSTTILSTGSFHYDFFKTMDTKTMVILGGIGSIFILLLVGMILFFTQKKASNFQNVTDTSIVQGATIQDASASIGAQVKGLGAPATATATAPERKRALRKCYR